MSKRAGATVVESKGSHAVYVSRPQAVASIIQSASKGCRGGNEVTGSSRDETHCEGGGIDTTVDPPLLFLLQPEYRHDSASERAFP
jgi:hypothetical protein